MRVLIDTNVLLDVLINRADFVEASSKIWKLCEVNAIEGCVCALSIPNIVYIMRKELSSDRIKEIIERLRLIFRFTDLKEADLVKAAGMDFNDYEDAVQTACALRVKAQYIVTRNIKDYKNSPVPALKPEELLERL